MSMTCRARGAARAGTRTGAGPGGGISSTGSSPLLPSVLHNSSSCEIEPKAPSHLHARLWSPSGRSASPRVGAVIVCVAG